MNTREQEILTKMEFILEEYGLQDTLKSLIDSLQKLINRRGKSVNGLLVLETIRGVYIGYCRRTELDWETTTEVD